MPLLQPLGQRHPGLVLQEGAAPARAGAGRHPGAPARAGSAVRQEPQVCPSDGKGKRKRKNVVGGCAWVGFGFEVGIVLAPCVPLFRVRCGCFYVRGWVLVRTWLT